MQGDFAAGFYGVHTSGHFTIGGDPGGDLFTSPGDAMFFLHHGQIDRTWWIWQNQDLATWQNAITRTITLLNNPTHLHSPARIDEFGIIQKIGDNLRQARGIAIDP